MCETAIALIIIVGISTFLFAFKRMYERKIEELLNIEQMWYYYEGGKLDKLEFLRKYDLPWKWYKLPKYFYHTWKIS